MNRIFADNKIPVYLDAWADPDRFSMSFNGFPIADVARYVNANSPSIRIINNNVDDFLLPISVADLEFALFKSAQGYEKFFYPIGIHWWYTENINTTNNIFNNCLEINQSIIAAINDGRCKIILYNPFEGWAESFWQRVIECIIEKYNTLKISDFIVICNNVNITQIKSVALLDNQQFDQSPGHFRDFETLHHYITECIVNKVTRPYKFVALMRRPRPTRWAIMTELHDDRDKGLMSFSIDLDTVSLAPGSTDMLDDNYATAIRNSFFVVGSEANRQLKEFSQAYPDIYEKFSSKRLYMYVPFWILGDVNPKLNPKRDDVIFKYTDSYLHIVSETYFRGLQNNHLHFSEKIFKPIWYLQPFVLFGKCGALYNFTQFGYKTFAKWIDETYDQIEDDTERFHAAIRACREFYLQPENRLNDIMLEMLPILQHNFETLKHNQKNQTTLLLEKLSSLV